MIMVDDAIEVTPCRVPSETSQVVSDTCSNREHTYCKVIVSQLNILSEEMFLQIVFLVLLKTYLVRETFESMRDVLLPQQLRIKSLC